MRRQGRWPRAGDAIFNPAAEPRLTFSRYVTCRCSSVSPRVPRTALIRPGRYHETARFCLPSSKTPNNATPYINRLLSCAWPQIS